jgi:hypothetical protein
MGAEREILGDFAGKADLSLAYELWRQLDLVSVLVTP